MKKSDVKVGGLYSCRVSGRIVPVRVLREFEKTQRRGDGWQRVVRFQVENTRTGRKLIVSGQRLRQELKQRLTPDGLVPTTTPVGPAPEGHDVKVLIGTGGSLYVFTPQTARAREWVEANVQVEPWQSVGGGIAVEHRFAANLADGMIKAGLRVSRPVREGV